MCTTIDHNNYEEHLDNLLNALDSCNFLDAIALVRECEAKGLVIYPDDNGIDIYDGEDPINESVWQNLLDNLHKYYAARR